MFVKIFLLAIIAVFACNAAECPTPDTRPATRLPHETDCTLHYVCQNSQKIVMPPCPTGMKFDTPTLSCRADARCGPASTTTAATTTKAATTTNAPTSTQTHITAPGKFLKLLTYKLLINIFSQFDPQPLLQ